VGILGSIEFGKKLVNSYPGKVFACNDVDKDKGITPFERNLMRLSGFRSYMAIPIFKENTRVGVLAIQSANPREWDPEEIEMIQITGQCFQ
jgi:GAF domain-containing protein